MKLKVGEMSLFGKVSIIVSSLLYLLVVLSPAGIAWGWVVHLRYFVGEGSLKAQGGVSSWVPELDPESLGDTNAGKRFLQVPSIGINCLTLSV